MSPRATRPPDDERCGPAADLTAFALDELPASRRAAISRHLLRCASCRARLDREQALFERLHGFAESPSWEDDLAAADLARSARARARLRGALLGAAAAAALVVALLAIPSGPSPANAPAAGSIADAAPSARREAAPIVAAPSASAVSALLRAQAADGRWRATTGGERHDVGATGLAVLALVRDGPDALRSGPAARAIAQGVRWLAARVDDDARAERVPGRDRAVAAAALLEVYRATNERTLRPTVDRALRRVSHDARESGAAGADAAVFARSTLARARDLGWAVGPDATAADESATRTPFPAGLSTVLAYVDATPAP